MREIHRETIAARAPWSRIIDCHGQQAVDFLCYNAGDFFEHYHAPNTISKAGHILLTTGDVLHSDRARPLFAITADTFGGHDTIGGCCSAPSNGMLYGVPHPGCRENFLSALEPYGLGWRDIVPNVNWLMTVPVGAAGDAAIALGSSRPGDHVDIKAQMDVLAVISNCPQMLSPCNNCDPTAIEVVVFE